MRPDLSCASIAIMWRLQGSRGTVMTCCLDRLPNGRCELRILHNGDLQMREQHASAHDANQRADALARTLTLNGWIPVGAAT
jgi:hypothetical protein